MKDSLDAVAAKLAGSAADLSELLDEAMDAIVAAARAERGFIVLVGEDMSLSIRCARNIDGEEVQAPELKISRTVIGEAIATGEPILTAEAITDARFGGAESVKRMEPLSILCVPLKADRRTFGAIYLDNRFLPRLFVSSHRDAVAAFAAKVAGPLHKRLKSSATAPRSAYGELIGGSAPMQKVYAMLDKVAPVNMAVLIYGESGTGKELVARAIHLGSPRRAERFVAENCAAIVPTLIESELFGHMRGSFTGADREKPGLLEAADRGTLFLDEISSMPLELQARLLRALQEGEIRRVGGQKQIKIDVRVLAASNQKLERLVAEGRFRQDLYYRLKVIEIDLPPLRDRAEDVPQLAHHFLDRFTKGNPKPMAPEAMRALQNYTWPGNVRELENEIRRALALSDEQILPEHLSPEVAAAPPRALSGPGDFGGTLREIERNAILTALKRAGGNKKEAAKHLGVPRTTLYSKMKLLGLDES